MIESVPVHIDASGFCRRMGKSPGASFDLEKAMMDGAQIVSEFRFTNSAVLILSHRVLANAPDHGDRKEDYEVKN